MRASATYLPALLFFAGCPGTLDNPAAFLAATTTGGSSGESASTTATSSSSSSTGNSASSGGSSSSSVLGGSSSGNGSSGGSSSGSSSSGAASSAPPPNCDAPTQVFDQICASCHGPAPENLGALDLISPDVASRLIGVTPALCETSADGTPQVYVVAGEPNESYLYDKVSSAHPVCGNRMPQNEALSDADQQCVFDWIANLDAGYP